jgi:DNA-binding GntR family transcriptional regulator
VNASPTRWSPGAGRIYKGELSPVRDRITEASLAAEFNVSRVLVREALAILEKERIGETLLYPSAVVARLRVA